MPVLMAVQPLFFWSSYELEPIQVVESFSRLLAKYEGGAYGRTRPEFIGLQVSRIRPHHIVHWSFLGHFHDTIEHINLLNVCYFMREASIDAKYFTLNRSCQRKIIEDVCAVFPGVQIAILFLNFLLKLLSPQGSRLMSAPQQSNTVRIFHFEAHEELDCLRWSVV